ncbi:MULTISPECIES: recombinase [Bacteroides]|uniref:recombinase n=1 Tax=Bacteroides TaxID=816 RepID=UPI00286FA685|nr:MULTISPECIES: recombinase [Bacteroides]MDV6155258.1 recombinase [Bacteroides hominis (ex Liu et al. 2022)]
MLAKCLIINVLRLIIVILFFIAFLNITYTARHTWATLAREYGAPVATISTGLGHTKEEMTLVYLKELDRSNLKRINGLINSLL